MMTEKEEFERKKTDYAIQSVGRGGSQNVEAVPSCAGAPGSALIAVLCFIYPDGTTYWMSEPSDEKIRAEVELWKSHHPEYEGTGVSMAVAEIRMFEQDYIHKIVATNRRFPGPNGK